MKKYKVGYTDGVYDLFHIGHLNLFEKSKKMCDKLIVGVCDDEYVRNVKHTEPIINEQDRLRIVKALKCVDEAYLIDTKTTLDKMITLEKFKFNVFFAGDDWKGTERWNKIEKEFKEKNVDVIFFPYTKTISTTDIKHRISNKTN